MIGTKMVRFSALVLSVSIGLTATADNALSQPTVQSKKECRLGLFLQSKNQWRKSIPYFDRAIKLDPTDAWSLCRRAQAKRECEDVAGALVDVNKAIALDPKKSEFYFQQSRIYSDLQKTDLAIQSLGKGIALHDNAVGWWFYSDRSHLLIIKGDYTGGLNDLCQAVRLSPKEAGIRFDRAVLYFRSGRYKDAVDDLTVAYASKTTNDRNRILQLRAQCYDKLGKTDLAAADRKQCNAGALDEWGPPP